MQLPLGYEPTDLSQLDEETRAEILFDVSPFEIQDELPIGVFSPSSISTLLKCPEQFRRVYVHKERKPPGPWAVSGQAFHEARRFMLATLMEEDRLPSEAEIQAQWDKAFRAHAAEGKLSREKEGPMRTASWSMLQVYNREIAPKLTRPVAIEKGRVWFCPGVPIPVYGKLDCEYEHEIVDTKTGSQSVSKPRDDWLIQGLLYMTAVRKPMAWHSVGYTKAGNVTFKYPPKDPGLLLQFRPSREETAKLHVETAYAMLLDLMRTRGPDKPWPGSGVVSGSCSWCDLRQTCPFYIR